MSPLASDIATAVEELRRAARDFDRRSRVFRRLLAVTAAIALALLVLAGWEAWFIHFGSCT